MPDWYENEPQMMRGDDFYMRAFWELCSERQFGHSIGPIPHSKIVWYGERCELGQAMLPVFIDVMRELDEMYLDYQRSEQKRRTETTRKNAGKVKT